MFLRFLTPVVLLGMFATAAQANYSAEAVPGEYIVKFKTDIKHMPPSFAILDLGADSAELINKESNSMLIKRSMLERPEAVLADLADNPNIEYIEPNYIWSIDETLPNDPQLDQLWGLINNGKSGGAKGMDISAKEAWDLATGDRRIVVAVVDTGIDYTHPDLRDNMWINEAERDGEEGVDDDGNGFVDDIYGYDFVNDDGDPVDDWGHGTHVAGTIGARGNDGVGIAGVAWEVSLMSAQIFSRKGSVTTEKIIRAIDYSTLMEADIMNNSWGGGGFSQALLDSIERANDAGILFVAAAGNSGRNNDSSPHYPSSYDASNILAVASITRSGSMSSFSNYGLTSVDVAAPGSDVYSCLMGGGYGNKSGTSMATPHVAGLAALLLSYEDLDVDELKERIMSTARPLESLKGKVVTGLVNANLALINEESF